MTSRQPARKSSKREPELRFTIGIVSDTHIPDRVSELHPLVLPSLRAAQVTHIFHTGDICSNSVLSILEEIAPVTAVRGNRDWFVQGIPMISEIKIGGVPIALMHGHQGILRYVFDKIRFFFSRYDRERYRKNLPAIVPDARVIIFGHTHIPEIMWMQEKLLFNPGSASFGARKMHIPTMGYLRIYEGGLVKPSIQYLKGYKIYKRHWIQQAHHVSSQ